MMMTSASHQLVHCAPAAAQWLGYRNHSHCAADGGLGLADHTVPVMVNTMICNKMSVVTMMRQAKWCWSADGRPMADDWW